MATNNTYLGVNTKSTASDNDESFKGNSGTETVVIDKNATKTAIDQNIEVVDLSAQTGLTFLQKGNSLAVYATDAVTLLASVVLQQDVDGTRLTLPGFTDPVSALFSTTTGKISIGDVVVSDTTPSVLGAVPTSIPGQTFTLKTTTTTVSHNALVWEGVSYDSFKDFITHIDGFDALGVPVDNIVNINGLDYVDSPDSETGTATINFQTDVGGTLTATAEMSTAYFDFLNNLIFDETGKSRLVYGPIETEVPTGIVLTPSVNNGGTYESGFTTSKADTIFAGRPELLHGASIDGGAGYDTIEVDMKGAFAQPLQLLNIEQINIQNLPNVYGLLENLPNVYDPLDFPEGGDVWVGANSTLDLSRAASLQKLLITEGGDVNDVALGDLTIIGIRNNATVRLEGGFSKAVTLHYGEGVGVDSADNFVGVNVELQLGDTENFELNIAHNASILNLKSEGYENWLKSGDLGGKLSKLNITGDAALYIEDALTGFRADRPAIIDASASTGGVHLSLENQLTVQFTGSTTDDIFTSTGSESVTVSASEGNDKVIISAEKIAITTGAGNNQLILAGLDIVEVDDISNAALVTLNLGAGSNTIELGNGDELAQGLTALDGSSITGENVQIVVEYASDLSRATLTGITKVTLKDDLTLTADQFATITAPAFSVDHASFGQIANLNIIVDHNVTFGDLITDELKLSANVRLNFDIQNGATLTLTAEQLHDYVAAGGIEASDGLNGKVVITDAGLHFDPFNSSGVVIDGGVTDGGSLTANFEDSDDVTITRSVTGFERPETDPSSDMLTIDTTGTGPLVIAHAIDSVVDTLKIVGDQNIEFQEPVKLSDNGFTIDFSELAGTVSGLTVQEFDRVSTIIGNGKDGTRINVELNGDVGEPGLANGLKSSGVAEYVVTAIGDTNGDYEINNDSATFYVCDNTKDVKVLGLSGNQGNTITFANVPWGNVSPTFLLEGDGYANFGDGPKADGDPDASNVGTLIAEFFYEGAPAVVNINNQGTALGITSTGTPRPIVVDGIELVNAAKLTINVADGNADIRSISSRDEGLKDLTLASTNAVTVHLDALDSALTSIDASAVVGNAILMIDDATDAPTTVVDLSHTTLTDIDGITLGNNVELTLTFAQIEAINIDAIKVDHEDDLATLNISGLGNDPLVIGDLDPGVNLGAISIAADPVVTLDPTTNLTGADSITVYAGTTLSMTVAQFQQLDGAGTILGVDGTTEFVVNITDLKQADVNAGLDLSGITGAGTLTLAENVLLAETTELGNFAIELAKDQTITLSDDLQAHERVIGVAADATNTMVKFAFPFGLLDEAKINFNDVYTTVDANVDGVPDDADGDGVPDQVPVWTKGIDTSHYSGITMLQVLNELVQDQNVEQILAYLDSSIVVDIVDEMEGALEVTDRVVIVEPNAIVDGKLIFDDLDAGREVGTLDITLKGGTQVVGNIDIANATPGGKNFQELTVTSEGDKANVIDGALVATNNDLLNVAIDATQVLSIDEVTFSAVAPRDVDNKLREATLAVTGTAAVTIGALDTTNGNVATLNVVNSDTADLTITGSATSPAFDGNGANNLVLSGTGNITFGSGWNDADGDGVQDSNELNWAGITSSTLSEIDASALTGKLALGRVTQVDGSGFSFTSGTGVTTLTLAGAELALNAAAVLSVDLSKAADGSVLKITDAANFTAGTLKVTGTAFADTVMTRGGDDSILAGVGNDTIISIAGEDTINGGDGADTLTLVSTANSLAPKADAQLVSVETVTAAEATAGVTLNLASQSEGFTIIGSSSSDTITGGKGADSIASGAGDDSVVGFVGKDTIDGSTGTDTLELSSTSKDLNVASDAQLVGVETIKVAVAADLNLASQTENLTIIGSDYNDTITSGSGADTITGGKGFDVLTGGAGSDTFKVTADTDTITITDLSGSDVLVVSAGAAANATVSDDFTATAATVNNNSATLNLLGSANANLSLATGTGYTITAGDGGSEITGSSANDTVNGGSENDRLDGGDGNDLIQVVSGNDTVVAGAGDDIVFVALGEGEKHTVTLGEGRDNLLIANVDFADKQVNQVTVTDFDVAQNGLAIVSEVGGTSVAISDGGFAPAFVNVADHSVLEINRADYGTYTTDTPMADVLTYMTDNLHITAAEANANITVITYTADGNAAIYIAQDNGAGGAFDAIELVGILQGVGIDALTASNFA